MNKFVIFAFKGEVMCFVHVLLNALDMKDKGMDVRIVIEGEAVTLIQTMMESGNVLFDKALKAGLFDCVCKACSNKMGVLEYNEKSPIPVRGSMNGHPAMADYVNDGYYIITL